MAALLPTAAQRYNSVEIVSAPRQQNETNNKIRLVAFVALAGVFLLSSTLNSTHSSTSSLAVTQSSVTIGNSRPAVTTNSRQPKGPSPVRVNQAVNPVTGKLLAPKQAATLGRMSALPTASGDVRERLSPDMAPSTESTSQVGQGQWALAAFVMLLTAAAAFFMYGRSTPKYAMMAVEGEDVEVKVDKKTTPLTVEPVLDVNDGMSVEEVEAIQADSASALEVMYIDALWAYYSKDETNMLSNEDFDRLKMELNWQGSGFPSLRRYEVEFVEAVIAYYRGQPIMSDEEYEKLKQQVRDSGKRQSVTAFLLEVKGKQFLAGPDFEKMREAMVAAGVEASPAGVACTLSSTPTTLQNNVADLVYMYTALAVVPSAVCTSAWAFLALIIGGPGALINSASFGLPGAAIGTGALWAQLIRYLDFSEPIMVKGQCPCCESPIMQTTFKTPPGCTDTKCDTCSTPLTLDTQKMIISKAGGFAAIGGEQSNALQSFLTKASYFAFQKGVGSNKESKLGGMKAVKPDKDAPKPPAPESRMDVVQSEIKTGIFAWAVLLGYAIFGEMFVSRARGKGIAIHSGVINDFCKRFAVPGPQRQKFIQTAKRNGHDLGFLVDGKKQFGDGIFGKQAMEWWKEQGF